MAKTRPGLSIPTNGGGSILDDMMGDAAKAPPGQPPFARPRPAEPPPAAAPDDADADETPPPPPAPRQRDAATPRRPARARRTSRQTAPGIPEPPPGYIATRKPLQVYVDGQDHWDLKYGCMIRGVDMSKMVAAMVSTFNADPDAWTALIARAEEERKGLGELLAPYLATAVEELT